MRNSILKRYVSFREKVPIDLRQLVALITRLVAM
jgi:hypothetical protein